MEIKRMTVSQYLNEPRVDRENLAVFLINSQESSLEILRVALPESCNSCGNWFDLPSSAVESIIPLGVEECCDTQIAKVAIHLNPDYSEWIEILKNHFSPDGGTGFEVVGDSGSADVCEADQETGFEALGEGEGELSGKGWVARFPTSRSILDLKPPFLSKMIKFHNALIESGATVKVNATVRPPERAYLMHWSFKIAKGIVKADQVPAFPGVEIIWTHASDAQSRAAAQEMVNAYQIAFAPAVTSNHIRGLAVDMMIGWSGTLKINDANGNIVSIGAPTSGGNSILHQVGKTYGVIKLVSDPPHWSDNGH